MPRPRLHLRSLRRRNAAAALTAVLVMALTEWGLAAAGGLGAGRARAGLGAPGGVVAGAGPVHAGATSEAGGRFSVVPPRRFRIAAGSCVLEGPPGLERAATRLAASGGPALSALETDLGARFAAPFRMVLIPAGGQRDPAAAALERAAPPWAAGFVTPGLRVGAIRVAQAGRYPYGTLESVLVHEATHVLLFDRAGGRLPLWFDEGLATWEARRWSLEDAWIVSGAMLTGAPPRLAALEPDFHGSEKRARRAYAVAFSFVAWTERTGPPLALREILRRAAEVPFERAWAEAMGLTLEESETEWRKESVTRYRWIPIATASSAFWLGLSMLTVVAAARRRARARAERARWVDELTEPTMENTGEPGREPGVGPGEAVERADAAGRGEGADPPIAASDHPPAGGPPIAGH